MEIELHSKQRVTDQGIVLKSIHRSGSLGEQELHLRTISKQQNSQVVLSWLGSKILLLLSLLMYSKDTS